jgi:type II secretory pathway component PulF
LYCNLAAAGEVSGSLPSILRRLATNLAVMADLQAKVTQAMIYPAFLLGACVVLMVVFMTFMVPQIMDLMGKNGQQLPAATQLLISFNNFMGQWWWAILIAITAVFLTFRGYISSPGPPLVGRDAAEAAVVWRDHEHALLRAVRALAGQSGHQRRAAC